MALDQSGQTREASHNIGNAELRLQIPNSQGHEQSGVVLATSPKAELRNGPKRSDWPGARVS